MFASKNFQLYFLSILLNGFTGFLFVIGGDEESDSSEGGLQYSLNNGAFRLILGVITAVIGVLKLLSPMKGNLPILGDMIPALGGVAAGFILLFGYYRERNAATGFETEGNLDRIGDTFLRYKKLIGIILIVSALLHFLFPQALFL